MNVHCPHCRREQAVASNLINKVVECPSCHRRYLARPPVVQASRRRGPGFGAWVLLILLIGGGALGYVCWHRQTTPVAFARELLERINPQPAPVAPPPLEVAPAPLPEDESAPAIPQLTARREPEAPAAPAAPDTPAPEPAVSAAPVAPAVIDPLAWLREDRTRWPHDVALTTPVRFSLKADGQAVGSILLPIGSLVRLLNIEDDQVTVAHQTESRAIPLDATDLLARARAEIERRAALVALAAARRAPLGAAPPSASTPPVLLAMAPRIPRDSGAPFVHPGGLHTKADLDRMKAKVAAGATPWIECWEKLVRDGQAQSDYHAHATPNLGDNDGGAGRQRASRDAHAAYLNFIRWYVTGDRAYAECAIRICNEWSAAVNQQPSGHDIPGLSGIPIGEFAMAGELLRSCPLWKQEDQARFKHMMRTYFYPHVKAYLDFKNRTGSSNAWANWDICNVQALIAMGVLLDDRAIFDEGVEYFKNGRGTGSIKNAVYFLHPGGLGQWQESGRDQGHAHLGVGMLAQACEIAWNQGVDLFGYDNNRLLAGAEYVAATSLWVDLPFKFYTNDSGANNYWIAYGNGGGRLSTPIWELLYNHYVVRQGLKAPYTSTLARLVRPEAGGGDHFGYGTLTYTLDAAASPYPPLPKPAAPAGLVATAGVGRVFLKWQPAACDANGYTVRRATSASGPFEEIASWTGNTTPQYTDATVENGVAYSYEVAAHNQAGDSPYSARVSAKPVAEGALPAGWTYQEVGPPAGAASGGAGYAAVSQGTFIVRGGGNRIGGESDSFGYACRKVTGDFTFTARLVTVKWAGSRNRTGLMLRESLKPESGAAFITLGDIGARQTRFGVRESTGARTQEQHGNDYTWAPSWYRLSRAGGTVTASQSLDGKTWFEVGSGKVSSAGACYVGLAVCSQDPTQLNTSTFDNVNLAAP